MQSAWRYIGGCRYAEKNKLCLSDKRTSFVKKSLYPTTGYSGYVDELLNQLNTAVISYASVCILQAGAFRILQKIFQKLCPLFGKAKSRLYYPAKRGGTTAFRQKGGEHHDT